MKFNHRKEDHKQGIYFGGLCPNEYWQQFQNKENRS